MWNTLFQRLFDDRRIVGVEEHITLALVEVGFMFSAGRFFDTVRVVQQHAKVADAANAGF